MPSFKGTPGDGAVLDLTSSEQDVAGRYYKACQTCRKQKMRCNGSVTSPCRKCLAAKVDCVFEQIISKRPSSSSIGGMAVKKRSTVPPDAGAQSRVQNTVSRYGRATSAAEGVIAQSYTIPDPGSGDAEQPIVDSDIYTTEHSLSPENLSVPVTAVHVMLHPPRMGEAERNSAGWNAENQSRWHREALSYKDGKDLVTRGQIDEPQARHFFEVYLHNANLSLGLGLGVQLAR